MLVKRRWDCSRESLDLRLWRRWRWVTRFMVLLARKFEVGTRMSGDEVRFEKFVAAGRFEDNAKQ